MDGRLPAGRGRLLADLAVDSDVGQAIEVSACEFRRRRPGLATIIKVRAVVAVLANLEAAP